MADKKISQLTAITAPIAGTDVLPIVQSATTKKITVAQLVPGLGSFTGPSGNVKGLVWTDGTVLANDATVTDVGYDTSTNTVQAKNLTVATTATITNGNLVIGTSGKGIDFSATPNSPYGTMTSEIFYDYEEGTWTPVLYINGSSTGITGTFTGTYTKIGRVVTCFGIISLTSKGASVGTAWIGGLPYVNDVAGGGLDFVYTSPTSSISTPFTYRIDATTSFAIITGSTNSNITDTTVWAFKIVYQAA